MPTCNNPQKEDYDDRSTVCNRQSHFMWDDYPLSKEAAEFANRCNPATPAYRYYQKGPNYIPQPNEDSMSTMGPRIANKNWKDTNISGDAKPNINEAKVYNAKLKLLAARTKRADVAALVKDMRVKLGSWVNLNAAVQSELNRIEQWSNGRDIAAWRNSDAMEAVLRDLYISIPIDFTEELKSKYGSAIGKLMLLIDGALAAIGLSQLEVVKADQAARQAIEDFEEKAKSVAGIGEKVLIGAGVVVGGAILWKLFG
jgi:hypothetical protein